MANVTFSSPKLSRDVTVYAVAGARGTLLELAKEHKVPIPFDCQDGECGSCLCRSDDPEQDAARDLPHREGKGSSEVESARFPHVEAINAKVNDMPPHFRLACQYIVRDEDIIVKFEVGSS